MRSKPTAVVVYRLGSLGDTVVALPCLHRIKKSYPELERIALTNIPVSSKASALGTIVGESGLIHRVVPYPVGLRSIGELIELRASLRKLHADTLVYLAAPRGLRSAWRDVIFFRLCGFTKIIGAPLTNDLQGNRVDSDGNVEHEYSRMARCIAPLGSLDLESAESWDLNLSDEEREQARELLEAVAGKPRFTINMGGKVATNDWGIDNWQALIDRLSVPLAGYALLIVGSAEDNERASAIAKRWTGPSVNACGRVSPRVSGAAVEGSRLFIGHDSGPMHLAATVGVRCVALFGFNNAPRKWHPWGKGHRVIHDMTGVSNISVEQVVLEVEALLRDSDTASERTRVAVKVIS